MLGVAGLLAIALPIVFGLVHATPSRAAAQLEDSTINVPAYETVSIKRNRSEGLMQRILMRRRPDGFTAMNGTLLMLIGDAYGVPYFQISGLPEWPTSEKYDIEAKTDSAAVDELNRLSEGERDLMQKRMLQALLSDRFQLKVHRETKSLPEYALVIAENSAKLKEAKTGDTYPNGMKGPDGGSGAGIMMMGLNGGGLTAQGVPMANLVRMLSQQLGRTVVDRTGLTGKYDFTLQWTPDPSQTPMFKGALGGPPPADNAPSPGSAGPSIFTALQQQLGLKLEPQQGQVDMVVIDHVEMPTED